MSKMIIRRISDARDGEIASGIIEGIDQPSEDTRDVPFWVIDSVDDLDTAVRDIQAQIDSWHVIEANARNHRLYQQDRIERLLGKYGFLVAQEVPVELGKSHRYFTGPVSGGKYTHKPDRLPDIKLVDPDAALSAGLARQVPVIKQDTAAIRALEVLPADCGVRLIPQPTVSYSPPKAGA